MVKEDGERDEDGTTAVLEDCGAGAEDGGSGPEHGDIGLENHDSVLDDSGMASKDSNDKSCQREQRQHEEFGGRAVQLLAIRSNLPINVIYGYDWQQGRLIYVQPEGEVQEEGMVDFVPIGPREVLQAYGYFIVEVYTDSKSDAPTIKAGWDVTTDFEVKEYTESFCVGPGGYDFEIVFLVIPEAIQANVEVKLKLKDLGPRSRAVYGKIKASTTDYRNKSVYLFSCESGTSLSFPSGSTSVLPLSPSMVAVPCRWELELHIEVDLTVITTCDSQEEEQDKNLKFSLEFNHEIMSQERKVDDHQVEVNIIWSQIF